jgi:hypothetical protein
MKAERLLAKVEAGMVPVGPSDDREMITDEERSVFRRIGLRMKSYLPMGQPLHSPLSLLSLFHCYYYYFFLSYIVFGAGGALIVGVGKIT